MATIYDSQGRPWGGTVDEPQDPVKQAALIEEDRRLMLLIEEKLCEYLGETETK